MTGPFLSRAWSLESGVWRPGRVGYPARCVGLWSTPCPAVLASLRACVLANWLCFLQHPGPSSARSQPQPKLPSYRTQPPPTVSALLEPANATTVTCLNRVFCAQTPIAAQHTARPRLDTLSAALLLCSPCTSCCCMARSPPVAMTRC